MTQQVMIADDPLKRTEDERLEAERIANGGQPRKLFPTQETLNVIRGMASIFMTQVEAARVLGVSEITFIRFLATFTAAREAWDQGSSGAYMSLRRYQFTQAKDNVAMAIFLGKQYLGQSDRVEHRAGRSDVKPVDPAGSQQEAAERYAETMRLPPALRLIAPPQIEHDANEVPEGAQADMPE